jgi:hypothetical protein
MHVRTLEESDWPAAACRTLPVLSLPAKANSLVYCTISDAFRLACLLWKLYNWMLVSLKIKYEC